MVSEDALKRALERRRLSQGTQTGSPEPVAGLTPQPEDEEQNRILGFVNRLINPLVDVPDLPGGKVGEFVERGIEELSSPIGLASAAFLPVTGGASLGFRGALGGAARLGTRLAAEGATGAAASLAAQETSKRLPEDTNPILRAALTLGAGGIGGIGTAVGAGRAARALSGSADVANAARVIRQAAPPDQVVSPFINAVRQAKETLKSKEGRRLLKLQRGGELERRIGRGVGETIPEAARGATAGEQFKVFSAELGGKLPRLDFPELEISPQAVEDMYMRLAAPLRGEASPLTALDAKAAERGLNTILFEQGVPALSELKQLEKAFGPEFTEAIVSLKPYGVKQVFTDVINLPRAVLASADLSFPLRQGILALGADPAEWAKGGLKSAKAFADPGYAKEIDALVRGAAGTEAQKIVTNKLTQWGMDITGSAATPEEYFQVGKLGKVLFGSNEAGRILQGSERAFQTTGNYLRWSIGQKVTNQLAAKYGGIDNIPWEEGKRLTNTLNVITGRSGLKVFDERGISTALNAFFFAPNFLASRFIAPTLLPKSIFNAVKADKGLLLNPKALYQSDPILALQARSLGGFIGQGMAGLTALKGAAAMGWIPDFDINADPRSSEFGKGRIGATRIDFWGGYAPLIRYSAQAISGKTVSSRGTVSDIDPMDVIWDKFIRSKTSPIPSLLWDAKTGSSFIGDKVTFDERGIERQVADNLLPLFMQDVAEGFRESGFMGAAASSGAFFGLGSVTYSSLGEVKDDVAQQFFQKDYLDLTGPQRQLADQHPRIIEKEREQAENAPEDSFFAARTRIDSDRQTSEDLIVASLASRQITRAQAAEMLGEQQRMAARAKSQAAQQYGIPDAAPGSMLQQGLDQWFNLYDLADLGADVGVKTGHIDWEKYDQLEHELMNRLTAEQVQFIEDRARPDHTPTTQWFFNNREYISDSGYYDIPDAEFDRFRSRIQSIEPNVTSYGQLLSVLDALKLADPQAYNRLNTVSKPLRSRITNLRERARVRDPKLDRALYEIGRTSTLKTRTARNLTEDVLATQ